MPTWPNTMDAPYYRASLFIPRDKAKVEAGVLFAQRWILGGITQTHFLQPDRDQIRLSGSVWNASKKEFCVCPKIPPGTVLRPWTAPALCPYRSKSRICGMGTGQSKYRLSYYRRRTLLQRNPINSYARNWISYANRHHYRGPFKRAWRVAATCPCLRQRRYTTLKGGHMP